MKKERSCTAVRMMVLTYLLFLSGVSLLTSFLMSDFKVCTLNVNGARDVGKRACIYELLKLKKVNVAMLQETHSDTLNRTDWRREWDGEVVLSALSSTRAGVAVLRLYPQVPHSGRKSKGQTAGGESQL